MHAIRCVHLYDMNEWIAERLRDYEVVDVEVRRKWWINLKWYFGFCAKNELGEMTHF